MKYIYIYIYIVFRTRNVVHIQLFEKYLHLLFEVHVSNRVGVVTSIKLGLSWHITLQLMRVTVLHSRSLHAASGHVTCSTYWGIIPCRITCHILWITSIYIYHIIKVRQILSHHVTSCHVVSHHNYDISFGQIIATKSPRWRIQMVD